MAFDEEMITEEEFNAQYEINKRILRVAERHLTGYEQFDTFNRWNYMAKSSYYYDLVNQIFGKRMEGIPLSAKVPYYYEMIAIVQAMAISFGIISSDALEPKTEADRFYDPEWIRKMADEMHEH